LGCCWWRWACSFLAMALNKVAWVGDPTVLSGRFERWLPAAAPYARWYFEAIAIPGAPLFARLVPAAESASPILHAR
jgi:hypothetical protein